MFLETVTINGEVVPRFQYLGSSLLGNHQADKVLSYLNQRAFFPQSTSVPATLNVRSGSNVLGCQVLRNHPDAGWVVYFHGNGELAAECVDYCGDLFASAGVNVCFVEYRGYGQSDGEPALAAMLGDGEQVVRALGVPATGTSGQGGLPASTGPRPGATVPVAGAVKSKLFGGTADVAATTAKTKLVQIADEINKLLVADPNTTVRVTLEIQAEFPQGVNDNTKRAVSENANSLNFRVKEWE